MQKIIAKTGEIIFPSSKGIIQIDIQQRILPTTKYLIITHLTPLILAKLQKNTDPELKIKVSYELYYLLQKLQRVRLLEPINQFQQFQIIPVGFTQQFGEISLTAYRNDDSLTGSLALLIKTNEQALGYCAAFALAGPHLKRIHRWQKVFRQAGITLFLTSQTMFQPAASNSFSGEVGLLHHWEKFLNRHQGLLGVQLSPWNPERLQRYLVLAAAHQRKVFLEPHFASLLSHFSERTTDWTTQKTATIEQAVQVGGVWQLKKQQAAIPATAVFIDPACQAADELTLILERLAEPQQQKLLQQLGQPQLQII